MRCVCYWCVRCSSQRHHLISGRANTRSPKSRLQSSRNRFSAAIGKRIGAMATLRLLPALFFASAASLKAPTSRLHPTWAPQDLTRDNPGFAPIPDNDYVKQYERNTALWPVPREGYSTWKTAPMTPEPDPEPEPEPWRVKASRALSARTTPGPSWYLRGT